MASKSPEELSLKDILRTNLPERLSLSQHTAITFPLSVLKSSSLFYVLHSLSPHNSSQNNHIYAILHNHILFLYNLIFLVEVIWSRIRSCMHTSGMRAFYPVQRMWLFFRCKYSMIWLLLFV